jgi:hypothetical protein
MRERNSRAPVAARYSSTARAGSLGHRTVATTQAGAIPNVTAAPQGRRPGPVSRAGISGPLPGTPAPPGPAAYPRPRCRPGREHRPRAGPSALTAIASRTDREHRLIRTPAARGWQRGRPAPSRQLRAVGSQRGRHVRSPCPCLNRVATGSDGVSPRPVAAARIGFRSRLCAGDHILWTEPRSAHGCFALRFSSAALPPPA